MICKVSSKKLGTQWRTFHLRIQRYRGIYAVLLSFWDRLQMYKNDVSSCTFNITVPMNVWFYFVLCEVCEAVSHTYDTNYIFWSVLTSISKWRPLSSWTWTVWYIQYYVFLIFVSEKVCEVCSYTSNPLYLLCEFWF